MEPVRADALVTSRAKVLRHGPQGWVLEVERLEFAGGRLYRPARAHLTGRDKILQHLEGGAEDTPIRQLIEEMIEKQPKADNLAFDLTDEGAEISEEPEDVEERAVAPRVLQLEARVAAMSRTVENLRRLERRLSAALVKAQRSPAAAAAPASAKPAEAAAPEAAEAPAEGAAPVPMSEPTEEPADAEAEPSPPGEAAAPPGVGEPLKIGGMDGTDTPAAEDTGEPAPEAKLQFPDAAAWSEGLEALLGEKLGMTEEASRPPFDDSYWLCVLVDDAGEKIGAVLADRVAVVNQGGTLMMLGDEVTSEQLEAGEPTEDVLEAASEVFNVQTRCFNEIAGNPHVKTKGIERFDPSTHGWLADAPGRTDLVDENDGRTVLVSL